MRKTNGLEDLIDSLKVFHIKGVGVGVTVSEDVGGKDDGQVAWVHLGLDLVVADRLEALEEVLRDVLVGTWHSIDDLRKILDELFWVSNCIVINVREKEGEKTHLGKKKSKPFFSRAAEHLG